MSGKCSGRRGEGLGVCVQVPLLPFPLQEGPSPPWAFDSPPGPGPLGPDQCLSNFSGYNAQYEVHFT